MHTDWLAMEHYRLHSIERWPESPVKASRLAAVHSTIQSFTATVLPSEPPFECVECLSRRCAAKALHLARRTPFSLPKAA